MRLPDTIFARSTPPGKSGVAIVRVSGPGAGTACRRLFGGDPTGRETMLRHLRDGEGRIIDEALVLHFPEGGSFTGERVVELQCHGSPAVVRRLLAELATFPGFREAEAGEFTRRALEAGRLDLVQVEALSDLIEAETEFQRRLAVDGFGGALRAKADRWRDDLIRAAALVEATIDFADEDVPVDVGPEVISILNRLLGDFRAEIAGVQAAERVREGFVVAVVGPPNVGKSSLVNKLAGREAAIVTEIPGTTRDVVEVHMEVGGLPVTFLDTAGLRDTDDPIEIEGIARARNRAAAADLRIILHSGEGPMIAPEPSDLVLRTKSDLGPGDVSAVSGDGIDALLEHVSSALAGRVSVVGSATRERHAEALRRCETHLTRCAEVMSSAEGDESLAAQHLRDAAGELDGLLGRIGVEDVLDRIFASFCIGK